jgi:hypothetical protein
MSLNSSNPQLHVHHTHLYNLLLLHNEEVSTISIYCDNTGLYLIAQENAIVMLRWGRGPADKSSCCIQHPNLHIVWRS